MGTWHFANVPLNVEKEFGKKGQIQVKATLNGKTFYNSLMPHGNGRHFIVLGGPIRTQTGVKVGDTVTMTIELDERARTVEVPIDVEKAIANNKPAQEFFTTLAYSYKKRYVDWITSAKKEETRVERIAKAVEMLQNNEKLD